MLPLSNSSEAKDRSGCFLHSSLSFFSFFLIDRGKTLVLSSQFGLDCNITCFAGWIAPMNNIGRIADSRKALASNGFAARVLYEGIL